MEKTTRLTVAPTPLLCPQTMSRHFRKILKSPFFLFLFTFLLILFFSLSWVSAKEAPKAKPQLWQIDGIMAALDDSDPNVQGLALSKLGDYESQDLKAVLKKPEYIAHKAVILLKDKSVDYNVRSSAAVALGKLGSAATPYVKDLLDILKDKSVDSDDRSYVAVALGNLGSVATPYVKDLLDILKDKSVDSDDRSSAAVALGNLGSAATPYVKDLLDILKDKSVDYNGRSSAAEVLGNLGSAATPYVKDIVDILKDKSVDISVRSSAAKVLGNLGSAATPYVKDILNFLKDKSVDYEGRSSAAQALGKIRKLEFNEVVIILDNVYYDGQSQIAQWRFLSYFLGGGTDEVKTLLKWLGEPKTPPNQLSHSEGVKTLQVFRKTWEDSKDLQQLQADLARQIATVTKKVTWKWQDINLLQSHDNNLKTAGKTEDDTVQSAINNLEFWRWFFLVRNIILVHLAIWLTLILAYTKFPQVQAMFWNPWIRRILGFGYIGIFLTSFPYLRSRLFEPFKSSLLADAGLDNFNPQAYFSETGVVETRNFASLQMDGEMRSITDVIPSITGQIVLEGDSGLGKSMFLRHLVKTSVEITQRNPVYTKNHLFSNQIFTQKPGFWHKVRKFCSPQRIVVYLPAQKCDRGVVEAIQAKLQGTQNTEFLKNLIYNGAIDICIDGLNEVTADTRAKISQFVENYFRGNIIMTTQPLEWTPPSTAKKYELQPLKREQIQQFLISRQLRLPKDAKFKDTDYEQACIHYIAAAFNDQQSPEDLAAAQRILSNPMDLTLVALMLSQGKQPDLFHLQEQQYQLMATEYLQKWKHEFPLKKFSDAVYHMRLNDESAIPRDEFDQELSSMEDEKYKMVVSRQWENAEGESQKSWYFRHDKIMEFFLVQNFLGKSEEVQARIDNHLGDPRFRGVYLLLATLLPVEVALEVREKLIEYAAHTKDHTVTNTFVQLLKLRSPQLFKDGTFKQLLRQHEQKAKSLDWAAKFLELVGAKIKRENSLYLTIETIESRLSTYTPLPVLLTVGTPTDQDIIGLVQISEKLASDDTKRVGILLYRVSPDTTARIEMAKVRLRDHFVLIPIPLALMEQAFPNKFDCIGLLEEYVERYLQRADFFDDKNAISDTFSFFGRTELLHRLGEELIRYQGIGLFGLRKSGKTSVLLQLGFLLREHPVVHIDLQRYGGSRYGASLFNDILQSLSTLEGEIPYFEPLSPDKPAVELKGEFIRRVSDFARAIQGSKKYKLPIICFLDEVERIIPHPEDTREKAEEFNACFEALRVLIQEQRQLSLLVADVHPDCNRINMWEQEGVATNPVFSFFKEVFLSPFSFEETKEMLTNIGKLMGLEFDEATPRQIHHQSGGHPFVSRQLARFLTQKIKDKNIKPAQSGNMLIKWAMVEPYLEKTLTHKGELKNYIEKSIWEDLEKRDFEVAIALLQVLACNEHFSQRIAEQAFLNKLGARFTDNQCLDACIWLTNVGLLYHEEVENQDFYQIRIPLLSRWIQMQVTEEETEQCKIHS